MEKARFWKVIYTTAPHYDLKETVIFGTPLDAEFRLSNAIEAIEHQEGNKFVRIIEAGILGTGYIAK